MARKIRAGGHFAWLDTGTLLDRLADAELSIGTTLAAGCEDAGEVRRNLEMDYAWYQLAISGNAHERDDAIASLAALLENESNPFACSELLDVALTCARQLDEAGATTSR